MREHVFMMLVALDVSDLFEHGSALTTKRDGDLHDSLVIVPVTAPSCAT
jgi:hypothetical protein